MNKIVIIGANDFQNQLILKAKSMGYETHVFAWDDGAVGKESADFFYPISIIDKEKILELCKEIRPTAVASIASDLASITVNYLSEQLGLKSYNNQQCVLNSTNKFAMRNVFLQKNVPVPKFICVTSPLEIPLNYFEFPVIVKPTDRSGSRAITLVSDYSELSNAVRKAIDSSFEKKAIIEEYLVGDEYSCECISFQGKHYFLALTQKYTTGAPHFIETGHFEPVKLPFELHKNVTDSIFFALDALEIEFGASHTEFKIDTFGNVKIIEVGARMGGDCIGSDLVQLSTGYDYMRMVIDVAEAKPPLFEKVNEEYFAAVQFVFSDKDIIKLNYIKDQFPNCIYRVSAIDKTINRKVEDSSSRFGYYILKSKSKDEIFKVLNL